MKTSTIILILACVMVTAYAVADFLLQYYTGIEVSPALTAAWFTFWGVELINLAQIKISKVKHEKPKTDEEAKG